MPTVSLSVQFDVAADARARGRCAAGRWPRRAISPSRCAVGAQEGRQLNARYRNRAYATNVLTFVYDDVVPRAGDIVVCVPVVTREARAQGKTLRAHLAHLIGHGMLHLQGYDHERGADAARMEAREVALLARLGYRDPYAARDA
jgi:probable rRNA maturation factor